MTTIKKATYSLVAISMLAGSVGCTSMIAKTLYGKSSEWGDISPKSYNWAKDDSACPAQIDEDKLANFDFKADQYAIDLHTQCTLNGLTKLMSKTTNNKLDVSKAYADVQIPDPNTWRDAGAKIPEGSAYFLEKRERAARSQTTLGQMPSLIRIFHDENAQNAIGSKSDLIIKWSGDALEKNSYGASVSKTSLYTALAYQNLSLAKARASNNLSAEKKYASNMFTKCAPYYSRDMENSRSAFQTAKNAMELGLEMGNFNNPSMCNYLAGGYKGFVDLLKVTGQK